MTDNTNDKKHIIDGELTLGNSIKRPFSWVIDNIGVSIGTSILPCLLIFVWVILPIALLPEEGSQHDPFGVERDVFWAVWVSVIVVVPLLFYIGFANLGLNIVQGKKVAFSDFFVSMGAYIKSISILLCGYIVSLIPVAIMAVLLILFSGYVDTVEAIKVFVYVVGIALAVIATTYLWIRTGFAFLIYLDKKTSFIESFTKNWKLTEHNKLKITGIILIYGLILNALSSTFFGWLIVYPIQMTATAYVYKVLEQSNNN